VLLLLPPSEGKTAPITDAQARPVDLAALISPELDATRRRILATLADVSSRPDAADVLGVGPGLLSAIARNPHLLTAPAGPAAEVYTGVLYAAAGLGSLVGVARERATRHVRIASALWGVLSPEDRIPAYRLAMGVNLPGIGPLARAWRDPLAAALDPVAADGIVVDCRSSTYVAAWRPPRGTDWVSVRVLRDLDGTRTVVSHRAKHARGLLVHHLMTRIGPVPVDADELLVAAKELTGGLLLDAELSGVPARQGQRELTLTIE
jgi:cytoplasmic iron level regulating protein YaaA (DUF328/UPF0246 family)